jgi:hypothetical protein
VSEDENAEKPSDDGEASDSTDEPQEAVEAEVREPTPEEPKRVRRPSGRPWDAIYPKVGRDVAGIIGKGKMLENYFNVPDLGRLSFLDAAAKPWLSSLPSQSLLGKVVGDFMQPIVEPSWMKSIAFLNSDAYKLAGVGQSTLTKFSSVLFKHADFGWNTNAAALFAEEQFSWLKHIAPTFDFLARLYPANLRGIEGLDFEEVETVVMLDGIALYGVPRQEIAEKLIRAGSSAARREVLGRRWKAISADCRAAVESCTSSAPTVAPYLAFALAALDALDAGHPRAAQAMAATVLDTVVNGYLGVQRYKYTPNKSGTRTNAEYQELEIRRFIATAPLWQAYQSYDAGKGEAVPTTFSRHASVHGVSAKQYSRRNAVQAVLFVSSLLLFLDEEDRRNKGRP